MATRKKSWPELMAAIRATFRKWGITDYRVEPTKPPRARNRYHAYGERMVTARFQWGTRKIVLSTNGEDVAHDNLARLALTLESLRLNEVREIDDLMVTAYRQMAPLPMPKAAAPQVDEGDPYAVLGVEQRYPLAIIETIWKARLRVEHPDAGGSVAVATKLNAAMTEIRQRRVT